jgi:glycosyltransferase involved in cell wall biosynthesis
MASNKLPLVSICIPTYNRADMVKTAIKSALAQTYPHIEILVVDNASTDNTPEIIQTFADPRLSFFRNEENLGIFGNFNRCIELARGDIIHILHSDDYIDPTFTETCVHFFEIHPEVSLTFTSARFITGENNQGTYSFSEDRIFIAPEGFKQILTQKISIICPSVMVRKQVYSDIGKYSLEYPYAGDYYQWLKISNKYTIGFVNDAWINYRIGDYSETYAYLYKNPLGYIDVIKVHLRLLIDLGEKREDYRSELNFVFYQFIKNVLSAGFLRSDQMVTVDASFFPGIAICSLSSIKSRTFVGKLKKCCFYLLIQLSGIFMQFSVFRKVARCILGSHKREGY